MKTIFSLVVFCCSICPLMAQSDSGKVEIVQDAGIQKVMSKYTEVNDRRNGKISGYRVQIHFGSDRTKAKEIKSKFMARHPEVTAYDPYEQPNFKVRVGDFRTKLEAYAFMKEIINEFQGAFIVKDDIELPRIE